MASVTGLRRIGLTGVVFTAALGWGLAYRLVCRQRRRWRVGRWGLWARGRWSWLAGRCLDRVVYQGLAGGASGLPGIFVVFSAEFSYRGVWCHLDLGLERIPFPQRRHDYLQRAAKRFVGKFDECFGRDAAAEVDKSSHALGVLGCHAARTSAPRVTAVVSSGVVKPPFINFPRLG